MMEACPEDFPCLEHFLDSQTPKGVRQSHAVLDPPNGDLLQTSVTKPNASQLNKSKLLTFSSRDFPDCP